LRYGWTVSDGLKGRARRRVSAPAGTEGRKLCPTKIGSA
jgi:hypothetical protein